MSDIEQPPQKEPEASEPTCSTSEQSSELPGEDSADTIDTAASEDSIVTPEPVSLTDPPEPNVSLTDPPEPSQSPIDHDKTVEPVEDDSSDRTSLKDRKSRELKLLLALSKESNLPTNISHKRKHLQTQRLREYKNAALEVDKKVSRQSSDGKNIRFPVTAEAELEQVMDSEVKEALGSPNVSGKIKRKRDSECSTPGGASEEAVKKHRKITAGEIKMFKENKDMFCWRCHRDGVNIVCETCPRAYHQKCLKQTINNPEHWPCPECVSILKAESTQTRSPAMKGMTLEHLCSLLKFAIKRMIQCQGSEPFLNAVSEADFPDYKKYIIQPMDLTKLEKNIKNNIYGSTQAFEADAKWLLHDSIIFNSYQSKLTSAAKNIVKICKQEMAEIENCPSCYLNANTKKNTWFVEVCPKPHILVWAKLKGFPYWPAKAMQCNNSGMVDVRFFGAHDRAWVHYKDCYLYSEKDPNTFKQKRYDIEKCIEELTIYAENLKKIYGEFRPAPFKTCYDPDNEMKQLQIFLPRYKHVKALMKRNAQNGEVKADSDKTDGEKDGDKSDESAKDGIEEKQELAKTPQSEKSSSKDDLKSEDRFSNFSSPVNEDKENLDTTMEGYGTDDDAAEIDLERRKQFRGRKTDEMEYEEEDDDDEEDDTQVPNNISVDSPVVRGNVRTRGGHNSTPGKLRVLPRRKSEHDKLKRTSTDEVSSPRQKLSRRNSDQSVKSDSSRISNISDKISRVDITENMEVSLGNDDVGCFSVTGKTSPVNSDVSKCGSEHSVEIKKRPVQVDIDNAEFTISPSNKLKIADKLIKRLSDSSDSNQNSDKVEEAKKNLSLGENKTQTDMLIERFKGIVEKEVIDFKEGSEVDSSKLDKNDEAELKITEDVQSQKEPEVVEDSDKDKTSRSEEKKETRTKTKAEKKIVDVTPPEKSDSCDSEETDAEEAPKKPKVMIQPSIREFVHSTLPSKVPEIASVKIKEKREDDAEASTHKAEEVDEVEGEDSDDEKEMVIDETEIYGKGENKAPEHVDDNTGSNSSGGDEIQVQKNKIKHVIQSSLKCDKEKTQQQDKAAEIEKGANEDEESKTKDSDACEDKKKVEESMSDSSDSDDIEAAKHRKRRETEKAETEPSKEERVNKPLPNDAEMTEQNAETTQIDKEPSGTDKPRSDEADTNKTAHESLARISGTKIILTSKTDKEKSAMAAQPSAEPKKIILKRRRTDEDPLTVRYKVVKVNSGVDETKKPQCDSTSNQSKDDGAAVREMSTDGIKSEPESDDDSSDNENLAAKMKYLSALNISEKTNVAQKQRGKTNEIRTRSKAEEKREKYRALDNVSKVIEEVAMNSAKEEKQRAENKKAASVPEGEIYVKSFAKLGGTHPTQQRARKSFPVPTYAKPKTVVLAKKDSQQSQVVSVSNKKDVQKSSKSDCAQSTSETPDASTPTPSATLTSPPAPSAEPPAPASGTTGAAAAENPDEDELATLHSVLPESLSRAVSELLLKPPPRLKPRPPGMLSAVFDEGTPSSAGCVTSRINSIAHRMGDYFRGMLIETLEDLGKCQNPEARITSLQLEMEALKHKHSLELSEMRNNICTILKDIQKSLAEDRERIIDETRSACEAETIKRVELAKSKQWCANCSKEAQFYCCWNTSYCDYPCQQKHWPQHMGKCTQNVEKSGGSGASTTPAGGASTGGGGPPTAPPQRPPGQQLILRPGVAKSGAGGTQAGVGRFVTKPTKVYMNKAPGPQKTFKTLTTSGNHITVIETSPGQFELVGNGPIAVAGKIYSPPGGMHPKYKSGGGVPIAPAARQGVPQLSSAPGTSKGHTAMEEDN
ncbi:unnamed protein product [Acanthoscelides obtectus]|uniref:Protein kinase C-binding protein 1 n=1 Tax=Acanthoscelides obtectus TaxID=200917 RepID=A0A9P0LHS9_ACAOB|nr:unnamed protein product [Acanthoscelides obtectus]CAK1676394.1 Protein kinase C-binding protein 1 [Acanthoscelides obtectus]